MQHSESILLSADRDRE